MTRFLSEALQAPEPGFRLALRHLEALAGHPAHDIRLSAELRQQLPAKLRELGLDPQDTAAAELYHTLQQRLHDDDRLLIRALQTRAAIHISAEGEIAAGMQHAFAGLAHLPQCLAIKSVSFKAIIRKMPPKKVMKQLGYRSLASFLKHESPISVLVAASALEDDRWHRNLLNEYRKLAPKDFENRSIVFVQADCHKWHAVAYDFMKDRPHNVLSFKELGAVVFMPLNAEAAPGTTAVSIHMAAQQINEIAAGSSYLKLAQARPDFGSAVRQVVSGDLTLQTPLLEQPVHWQTLHRHYAVSPSRYDASVFDPHVRVEDLVWREVGQFMHDLEPKLRFWRNSATISMVHAGKPVSCHLLDVAANLRAGLAFEQRTAEHLRQALHQELLLRYLPHETVEQRLLAELQPQLATEYAIA